MQPVVSKLATGSAMNTILETNERRRAGAAAGAAGDVMAAALPASSNRLRRPRVWEGLLATTMLFGAADIGAAQAQQGSTALPPVQIDAPRQRPAAKPKPKPVAVATVGRRAPRRVAAPRVTPPAAAPTGAPPAAFAESQDARTGTVGVYSNSTSVATKTNTPLVNIPQSINIATKEYIRDQNFQSVTDVTRYVPGVAVHQGEGNRDELVIRGVDSSANFYVNGFRDDVQIFRDLYNTQSVEIIKGPAALTFGRAAGGGILNRTLKEADGTRIYEVTGQTGSFGDRRVSLDAGQAINENFAARLNGMYEDSDTFRDFGQLERYGINPTFTWRPDDTTKMRLSYEYFHDDRTADRGNPSQALFATGAPADALQSGDCRSRRTETCRRFSAARASTWRWPTCRP